jgi:hypothetical protein
MIDQRNFHDFTPAYMKDAPVAVDMISASLSLVMCAASPVCLQSMGWSKRQINAMTEFGSARRAKPELCRDAGRRASNRYQIGGALLEVIQAVL